MDRGSTSSSPKEVSPEQEELEGRAHLLPMEARPFGKYVLIGILGKGGMGVVNLGVAGGARGFSKLVVVKRLLDHLNREASYVSMFLDEARLAARLNHPHCIQTYEVDDVDGANYLAMEYLEGLPLDRFIKPYMGNVPDALPVGIAARMIADALDGLAYAHELADYDGSPLAIVHRDISPQNLFVTYTGMVKILDFGIAKATTQIERTRTGVIKGKFAYIAPEQAKGEPLDGRADVWSMGVVLWELLTRQRLFKRNNEAMTLHETLMGVIRPPSAVRSDVPPELDAIVLKALAREPSERWRDAHEMKDALERFMLTLSETPNRRTLAALLRDRFADAAASQKAIVRRCLEESKLKFGASITQLVEIPSMTPSEVAPLRSELGLDASGDIWPVMTSSSDSLPLMSASGPIAVPPPSYSNLPSSSGMSSGQFAPIPPEEQKSSRRRRAALIALIGLLILVVVFLGTRLAMRDPDPLASTSVTTIPSAPLDYSGAADPGPDVPAAPAQDPGVSPVAPPSADPAPTRTATEAPQATGPATPVVRPTPSEGASSAGAGSSDDSSDSTTGSSARRRRREAAAAAAAAASASAGSTGSAAPSEPEPTPAFGFLSLDTVPWTEVSVDGRSLGTTPLVRVRLAAGRHMLLLRNTEQGLTERYSIEISAGETTTRRLGLR